MNSNNKNRSTTILLIVSFIVVFFVVMLFKEGLFVKLNSLFNANSNTENDAEINSLSDEDIAVDNMFTEIDLGSGIVLTNLSQVTGNFLEDGSDEFCENLLAATFRNDADRTIQYMTVNVTIGQEMYAFSFSTVPSGESVIAYEMNKKEAPTDMKDVFAEAEHVAFFQEEPSVYDDELEIKVADHTVTVKNISSETIDKEISIYYKNWSGNAYVGGITYRLRIAETLEPGESCNGFASHALETQSKVMFVTYGI